MKSKSVMGLIFANVHDDLVNELTSMRSMASVPYGGRYRLIDFPLSNLVNAGISKVGIIPKSNYHSLMDHIGSGKSWDLDRKSGGLFILPPYIDSDMSLSTSRIKSLDAISSFLFHCKEKYIVMCDTDFVGNIDFSKIIDRHIETGADITVAYKNGKLPDSHSDTMIFDFDSDMRVNKIRIPTDSGRICDYGLDIIIIERKLLISLVHDAVEKNYFGQLCNIFQSKVNELKIYGYEVKEFTFVIDSPESYAKANFALLNPDIRNDVFAKERPVYTKTRDDVPTRYGLNSKVKNSLIADGCLIEGTVKNSIIFRGVKIGAGSVVENCIIMQDSVIEKNVSVDYVTVDKNALISENSVLKGAETHMMFIRKGAKV